VKCHAIAVDYCGVGDCIKRTAQVLLNAFTGWYATNIFVLLFTVSIVEPACPLIAALKLFRLAKDSGIVLLFTSESTAFCPLLST
jgi:hypothetical protein